MTYYDSDATSRAIAARQRKAIEDARQGIFYDRPAPPPPKPKPTDDEEDNAPTYLSPAWHAARAAERQAAEAAAARAKAEEEAAQLARPRRRNEPTEYEKRFNLEPTKTRYVRKETASPAGKRFTYLHNYVNRQCEECGESTSDGTSLCDRHRRNRGQHGSILRSKILPLKAYKPHLVVAVKYLQRNPPPPEVLALVAAFVNHLPGCAPVRSATRIGCCSFVRWTVGVTRSSAGKNACTPRPVCRSSTTTAPPATLPPCSRWSCTLPNATGAASRTTPPTGP